MEVCLKLKISVSENAFEDAVCKIAAILSRPQCVNCRFIGHCFFEVLKEYKITRCYV